VADDDFPSVTADGKWLWLASDRAGGCGGRDIYVFPKPVRLQLRGTITQSVECDSGRLKITPLKTTVVVSGPGYSKEIPSDDSGYYAADLGEPGDYRLGLEGVQCSNSNISTTLHATRPHGVEATFVENINVPRVTLRDTLGKGSKIPFFITGYWRPNTSHNLQEFRERKQRDPAFANIHYIRDNDWDYEKASHVIDSMLTAQVYRPILDSLLPLLEHACFDSTYGLHIQVNGYTDSNHILVRDLYRDTTVTPDDQPPIRNGEPLLTAEADTKEGEWGNKRLSAVRAYFTEQEVLRNLIERSSAFRTLSEQGRIWPHYTGRGIDHSTRENLGFNRRVDIVAWIGNKTGACN
jgi:hypothetical protein